MRDCHDGHAISDRFFARTFAVCYAYAHDVRISEFCKTNWKWAHGSKISTSIVKIPHVYEKSMSRSLLWGYLNVACAKDVLRYYYIVVSWQCNRLVL
jgi:hypothetical protein